MKHLVKATYPCIIKTQNDFVHLGENDTLVCENEDFLYVYPLVCEQIPFCVDLVQKKDSPFFSFFKIEGESILLLEEQKRITLTQKESLSVGGKILKIFISSKKITFESTHRIISIRANHPTKKYKLLSIGSFGCVMFEKDFYAFSMPKEKLFHFDGEKLCLEKDTLSITKKLHDFSNRTKTYEIKFGDGITIQNEEFLESSIPQKLLCFDFLQAIKCKNFASAINFLSEKLKNKIKKQNLENFFGKIQNILPFSETEFLIISNYGKNYVKFELENEKICDISLDQL